MQKIMRELGYLKSESIVYESLLKHGRMSAGKVAKYSSLNRVSVYKSLDKLIKDGLVTYTIISNKRLFKAEDPSKIKALITQKEKRLKEFNNKIPQMIEQFNKNRVELNVNVYEGIKGLKSLLENFLKMSKKDDGWFVLGSPKKAELLGGFFKDLNERRAKNKVKLQIIYNLDADELIRIRKKQPLTKVRVMPKNYITPTSIEVLGDNTAIIIYSPIILAFHIKNDEVSRSFKQYFDLIWQISQPL